MKIAYCNKCNVFMEDNNPSDKSYEFTEKNKPLGVYVDMTRNTDDSENVFHCCPSCMDDGHLIDVTDKDFYAFGPIGSYHGFSLYTDKNMVKEEGFEYKMVPLFDICCLRWLKKTIRVKRIVPLDNFVILDNENKMIVHPEIARQLIMDLPENK